MVMEKAREISSQVENVQNLVQKDSIVFLFFFLKKPTLHIPVSRECEIKRVTIVANGGVSPHLQARFRDQRRKLGREGRRALSQ